MRAKDFVFSLVRVVLVTAGVLYLAFFLFDLNIKGKGLDRGEYWGLVRRNIGSRFAGSSTNAGKIENILKQIESMLEEEDFEGAKVLAEKAADIAPADSRAVNSVARNIFDRDGGKAATDYFEGLKQTKVNRVLLSQFYTLSRDFESSLKTSISLAEDYPLDAEIQAGAASAASQSGDFEQATKYLERAIKLDPSNESAHSHLLSTTKDRNKKKEILNKLIEIAPENSNYTGELGWMEYEDGNYERSVLFSRSAAEADPRAHYAHFNQALAELRLGTLEESWETYAAAVAGCIEKGENYPFVGALGDLVDLPTDTEPEFRNQVMSLLEQCNSIASQGLGGYLDHYGEDAYVFDGVDLISGEEISLLDYSGKLVFLDIWASWCGPCIAELPNVVDLQRKLGGERFQVVSISIDDEGAEDALQAHIEGNGITYPVLYSGAGWKQDSAVGYDVSYIPNTWLISPDGKILYHDLRGEDPYEYSRAYLDSNATGFSQVGIEASTDEGVLSFKAEGGASSSLVVDAIIIVPLTYGEGDGLFVERHHFTGDEGVVESEIELGAIEDSLGYVFWSIESSLPGIPDPIRKSGVIRTPVE